jgi:dTDP-4-dehydrorhamnose 3,5-epimerase
LRTVSQLVGGALVLDPPRFEDVRGVFSVLYESEAAVAAGLPGRFVQDNHSISHLAGTIRGIHLQLPPHEQGKLVRVLRGRILDVIVDLRPDSATVGRFDSVEMSADSGHVLWVPPGFGHGFCTLEPDTEVFYKVDAPYRPEAELTVAWNDPELDVDWPVHPDQALLSEKDQGGVVLSVALAAIRAAADVRAGSVSMAGTGGHDS